MTRVEAVAFTLAGDTTGEPLRTDLSAVLAPPNLKFLVLSRQAANDMDFLFQCRVVPTTYPNTHFD